MKTKFSGILTLLLAFVVQLTFAQEKTISGTVSDDSGLPLPGATVLVKGTSTGTSTDFDGAYTIKANQGAVLVYSFVGYSTKEISIGSNKTINVTMAEDAESLQEVVITALGISREKKTVGSSIQTIGAEELNSNKSINPIDAIQGKAAGVEITAAPAPGSTQNVIIRGASSFGNNQPLYVVDGVPLTNEQNRSGSDLNSQVDFGSGINAINPNDIATMTILKGASATALYGSRASNGIIMITTKSGSEGALQVNFNSSYSLSRISALPTKQSQFGQGWSGDRALDENGNWGAAYDGVDRVWGNIVDNSQNIKPYVFLEDNIKDFYDYGENISNSLSLSGGSDVTNYYFSISHNKVDGVVPTDSDSYERFTLSSRGSHKFKKLQISSSINYSNELTNSVPTGQGTSMLRSLYEIANDISIVDLKDYNNKFNNLDNYFTPYGVNPYYILDNDAANQVKNKFFGKFQIDYDILDNLKLTYRLGGDFETSVLESHTGIIAFSDGAINAGSSAANPGNFREERITRTQMNHDLTLALDNTVTKDISINTLFGFNANERKYNELFGEISSIDIPGFYNLNNSLTPATSGHEHEKRRLLGLYVSSDISYKNFLFFNFTARNDWSSTLSLDNNSFYYGGVNMSYILTDHLRSKDIDTGIFDFTKIRVAYGSTGNDADVYKVYDRYVSGYSTNPGFPNVDDLTFPLGGVNSYTNSNVLGNSDLKPEITKEFEIGIENRMFKGRFGFEISYYNKLTEGLIASLPLDPSTGYTSITSNLGDVRNKGLEVSVNVKPIVTDNFTWDVNWNYTKNKNKVESLDVEEVFISGFGDAGIYAIEGMALGQFKSSVPQTTMVNGVESTIVDGSGNPQHTTDLELLGKDINEKYRMGLTNKFSYKNISLAATLDFRYGGSIYSGTKDYMHWTGSSPESVLNDRNSFIIPNSVVDNGDGTYSENTTPVDATALHTFYSNGGLDADDYAVIDKSFLKLRNVTLAYNLPKSLCEKVNFNNVTFSFTASNFILWRPAENPYIDPENTTFGTDLDAKFGEFMGNPSQETFTLGLNINL
ncbi:MULTISPECIES: SusC/RagA family TonB-linked outer membrane protein [unclassified Algibacter]|uniref:SusC/RagA family TonB-linked outer membrane protein n=1 Tax=unclassified Algibacter TaxID=2615009 RepID=UPI00131C9908|nr:MULTISPECIES: SusC/RagA family TonB-linked outer membrane protein [unclassified Algibacter]MCL5129048.1 SusC/RagA family TonB-linked outer membrane protein [Algibacter sp. L4_22]